MLTWRLLWPNLVKIHKLQKSSFKLNLILFWLIKGQYLRHCMKSVRIRGFSGPYFPIFRLSTERYSVSLCIQSECGKIRIRKTLNTDIFHAVSVLRHYIRINRVQIQTAIDTWLRLVTYKTPGGLCVNWGKKRSD